MGSTVTLRRTPRPGPVISLVPMIDVMLILLVFFMVTSTYLNLDMIPAARQQDQSGAVSAQPGEVGTVLIRLGADGTAYINGRPLSEQAVAETLTRRIADDPLVQVLILPSGAASTQALISMMDNAARAGAVRMRVIRLEARQ